jgi:hypothetical protein
MAAFRLVVSILLLTLDDGPDVLLQRPPCSTFSKVSILKTNRNIVCEAARNVLSRLGA